MNHERYPKHSLERTIYIWQYDTAKDGVMPPEMLQAMRRIEAVIGCEIMARVCAQAQADALADTVGAFLERKASFADLRQAHKAATK